jgi:NADH dehydrogenase [ubiquinone] 1 alpha subcomplex assembly factor 7
MTELEDLIRESIAERGPVSVASYMQVCLGHPVLGYYMKQDPFGEDGDFTTAPEISQMFGELLGLWVIAGWQAAGSPNPVSLIELGPGRGTLMADALRAASGSPDFKRAMQVHLVETSPALRAMQQTRLAESAANAAWHDRLEDALNQSQGPVFILANEFLDALPIHQFELTEQGWRERLIGLGEGGALAFTIASDPPPEFAENILRTRSTDIGAIAEFCPAVVGMVQQCAAAIAARGGCALFVDYGYGQSAVGDTLQALKGHEYVSPFTDPGDVDLTAHVDFEAAARGALVGGAIPFGPVGQGEFLSRIGIGQRAERLAASNPDHTKVVMEALDRLTNEARMGKLFKVMALAPQAVVPPGFQTEDAFKI